MKHFVEIPLLWKTITFSQTVNTLAADDLAMQGARVSAASCEIDLIFEEYLVSEPEGLCTKICLEIAHLTLQLHVPGIQWVKLILNTLRPRQNGRHFPDDIFKCIFLNEKVGISFQISLTFVPNGSINNKSAIVQVMTWHQTGEKPLSEPLMVSLLTHICITRPQQVKMAVVTSLLQSLIFYHVIQWPWKGSATISYGTKLELVLSL